MEPTSCNFPSRLSDIQIHIIKQIWCLSNVMSIENTSAIIVEPSYVRRWVALSIGIVSAIPIFLIAIMLYSGPDAGLVFTVTLIIAVLSYVFFKNYKRAIKQTIYLYPNKIVFDYITYKQEFSFNSDSEFTILESDENWKIIALKDQSFKLVPKSAFPKLKAAVAAFYAKDITLHSS